MYIYYHERPIGWGFKNKRRLSVLYLKITGKPACLWSWIQTKIEEERKRLGLSLLLDKEVEEISIEDEKNSSDEHIEDSSEAEELESEDDVQKDENTEETEIVSMADTDQQNDEVVDSSAEEKAE